MGGTGGAEPHMVGDPHFRPVSMVQFLFSNKETLK